MRSFSRNKIIILTLVFGVSTLLGGRALYGAQAVEKKDSDRDGKLDTWIELDAKGRPSVIARDRHRKDGKPDTWVYLKNDAIYKREWDRNFDGRPDLRTLEVRQRLLEKQYDDDFDGRFEKTERPPAHGTPAREFAKTTAR